MRVPAGLPVGFRTWAFPGGVAAAREAVAEAVAGALAARGTLHAWAAAVPGRDRFEGRSAAFGVRLGDADAVVRHAHRGGLVAPFLGDRYLGTPRWVHEILVSERLRAEGVPVPEVLAAAAYPAGPWHRADVATARVPGRDLATIFFEGPPPAPPRREAVLRAAGRLVRRLHVAGWIHPDLQLRNVVVDDREAWLLDVDTCREAPDAASRRRNLLRFYRSWEKWNRRCGERLTAADRTLFESGYAEAAA